MGRRIGWGGRIRTYECRYQKPYQTGGKLGIPLRNAAKPSNVKSKTYKRFAEREFAAMAAQ